MSITVKATQPGYYGGVLRRAGDVFDVQDEAALSKVWMQRMDKREAKAATADGDREIKRTTDLANTDGVRDAAPQTDRLDGDSEDGEREAATRGPSLDPKSGAADTSTVKPGDRTKPRLARD